MTREQAINYLISSGFTHEQVGEVVRALTYEPTPKNDLGIDCISRKAAEDITWQDPSYTDPLNILTEVRDKIRELPSVTPQEPRCKDCKWWKDSDGKYRRGCGAESQCPINSSTVYCGEGYCYMFSPKADMRGKGMTRETAKIKVELLDNYLSHTCQDYGERDHEAMMMAIKALEQEQQTFKWCTDCKEYDQEKRCCHRYSKVIRNTVAEIRQEQEPVLDKIRAEIDKIYEREGNSFDCLNALDELKEFIDKYKGESEDKE